MVHPLIRGCATLWASRPSVAMGDLVGKAVGTGSPENLVRAAIVLTRGPGGVEAWNKAAGTVTMTAPAVFFDFERNPAPERIFE
jgi:hypothetical protein